VSSRASRFPNSRCWAACCAGGLALACLLTEPVWAQDDSEDGVSDVSDDSNSDDTEEGDDPSQSADDTEADEQDEAATATDGDDGTASGEAEFETEAADAESEAPAPRRTPMGAPVFKRVNSGTTSAKTTTPASPAGNPASRVVRPPLLQRNADAPSVELHTRGNTSLISNVPARVAEFKSQAREARLDDTETHNAQLVGDEDSVGGTPLDLSEELALDSETQPSQPFWGVRILLALMAMVALGIGVVLWLGSRRPGAAG